MIEPNPAGIGNVSPDDMWTVDIEEPSLELIFPNDIVEWTAIEVTFSPELQRALGENVQAMEARFDVVDKDSKEYTELPPTSADKENWQMPLNEKMRLPRDVFVTKIKITLIFPPDFEQELQVPELKIEIFGCTERK